MYERFGNRRKFFVQVARLSINPIPYVLYQVQVAAEAERDRDAGQSQDREEPEEAEKAGEAKLQDALGEATPA